MLERVVDGAGLIFPVRRLADDGLIAWDTVVDRGLEGLVAQDERAAYSEIMRGVLRDPVLSSVVPAAPSAPTLTVPCAPPEHIAVNI